MGRLTYNNDAKSSYDIPDEILLPLRIVVATKLRRSEAFMLSVGLEGTGGYRSLWIAPSVPLMIQVYAARVDKIDREIFDKMLDEAHSSNGLDLRGFTGLVHSSGRRNGAPGGNGLVHA
ncbi:ATP-dependent DNA ligase [Microbacterium sp. AG1240]|uniref:DUF7882 family protein n=1 Tax=Microbacterium sp. AG1240 TaxID=2183992 RepID=UPI0011C47B08|nr:ATP-dependent DNA ligase [Microbacterium sp. AG1240]